MPIFGQGPVDTGDPQAAQMAAQMRTRMQAAAPPPGGPTGPQAAQLMQAKQAAMQRYGANPPKIMGGGAPPPGGMPPDVAQRFQAAQAARGQFGSGAPPPPGGGLQAAGFAPRQGLPGGQFAGRFPGAQTPGGPQ